MVKECYTTNDKIFETRTNMAMSRYVDYDLAGFRLAPYGLYWQQIRKLVTSELFVSQCLEKLKNVCNLEVGMSKRTTEQNTIQNRIVQRTGPELRRTELEQGPKVPVPVLEFEIFRFLGRFGMVPLVLGSGTKFSIIYKNM